MNCAVCGGVSATVIELPRLPIGDAAKDQTFLQCEDCGHGMLSHAFDQACGYDSAGTDYSRRGIDWFLSFIPGQFRCALDFGCNDGYLLRKVRADRRIGVDLEATAADLEMHRSHDSVDAEPDLIISRHTVEHLPDPAGVLRALVRKAAPSAQFVIEVPCLDSLNEALRFDQIYHEHIQYFTIGSFHRLLRNAGLKVQLFARRDYPHSMLALCIKGAEKHETFPLPDIEPRYELFRGYTSAIGGVMSVAYRPVAYGASAIFPILLYHLGIQAGALEAVFDDDQSKHGKEIRGRRITPPDDISEATVLVTAPDSFPAIYRKLDGARRVMSAVPMF